MDQSMDAQRAVAFALRLLNHRSRTASELRRRMEEKGVAPSDIDEALKKLEGWGYIDDAAFARAWVGDRTRLRPTGKLRLARELRARGVAGDVIAETLSERSELTEVQLALDLLRRRQLRGRPSEAGRPQQSDQPGGAGARDSRAKEKRRLFSFLMTRGFSIQVAQAALQRLGLEDGGEEFPP